MFVNIFVIIWIHVFEGCAKRITAPQQTRRITYTADEKVENTSFNFNVLPKKTLTEIREVLLVMLFLQQNCIFKMNFFA